VELGRGVLPERECETWDWARIFGIRLPEVEDWEAKSKAPLLAKDARNGAPALYNHVNPVDEPYGDADDPPEVPAL